MQRLMKCCAKSALGLGAAALLLAGVLAHAGPASSKAVLAPADATRNSQPLRLAQVKTPPEEVQKLEQPSLQEQQEQKNLELKKTQPGVKPGAPPTQEMRRMEKSAPAPREVAPAKPGTSRFGAGVIRNKETDGD
jgi:hypothetical protein